MKFTKMHGLGNDYIYVNTFKEKIHNPELVAIALSERHTGIGSDGLILIIPSEIADFRMRMFNSDGSEAEMCGNGIRCIGKYVFDNGMTDKKIVTIETMVGIKVLELFETDGLVKSVKVDMGEPIFKSSLIPINSELDEFIAQETDIDGINLNLTCVSMGNPHAITYVEDLDKLPLSELGPLIEKHKLFPNRINAEFVKVISPTVLKMRVWERGAGETMACGTGACAVLVASVLNGYAERKAIVKLIGGDLEIEWNEEDNHVYMTGPATTVYTGEINIGLIDIKKTRRI